MNQQTIWYKVIVLFVLSALLAGCGGGAASTKAPSTTDLLMQSGFVAEPVKSPAHLQKLPGNQFTTVQQQGKTVYVYTDPKTNQLYFGPEAAYQRYQSKAAAAGAAANQQSSQNSMSPQDWTMYASMHGIGP
jgi:hypothetical protein